MNAARLRQRYLQRLSVVNFFSTFCVIWYYAGWVAITVWLVFAVLLAFIFACLYAIADIRRIRRAERRAGFEP